MRGAYGIVASDGAGFGLGWIIAIVADATADAALFGNNERRIGGVYLKGQGLVPDFGIEEKAGGVEEPAGEGNRNGSGGGGGRGGVGLGFGRGIGIREVGVRDLLGS